MKKLLAFLLILCALTTFTGCEKVIRGREEINKYVFIKAAGFDKSVDDKVMLTIPLKYVQSGGGGGGGGGSGNGGPKGQEDIITEEGRGLFEASRKAHEFSNKDLLWAHLKIILLGEDTAKDDIVKYLDFPTRDHELRLTSNVLITKDSSAQDFIKNINTNDIEVADKLQSILDDAETISVSGKLKLSELIQMLDSEFGSSYVPYLSLEKKSQLTEKKSEDKKDAELQGYGIIKGRKLIGYINGGTSIGTNIIINKYMSGETVVKDKKGNDITLEVLRTNADIQPKINNGKIEINIKADNESNIAEYEGEENIFTEEYLAYINKQHSNILKRNIESALKYAQSNKADFLGIGDTVYHKYPIEWDNYKNDWQDKIFPGLKINVSVKTRISRVYSIKEPTRARERK